MVAENFKVLILIASSNFPWYICSKVDLDRLLRLLVEAFLACHPFMQSS